MWFMFVFLKKILHCFKKDFFVFLFLLQSSVRFSLTSFWGLRKSQWNIFMEKNGLSIQLYLNKLYVTAQIN